MTPMTLLLLLLIFVACAGLSLLFCGLARALFPKFRSGEHKPGIHRPDQPAGGREIKSIELPLVGGPAFTLALVCTAIAAGFLLNFSHDQWTLLLIGIGTMIGYMAIGFLDDWNKVYSKEGIRERTKFTGVFLVSVVAAALYFFLLPQSGQVSYSFYKDLPLLGPLICHKPTLGIDTCRVVFPQVAYFGWLIFLMLMSGFIGSLTSISVDFSDGFDGLAGGLVFSAALAFGIVITSFIDYKHPGSIVDEVLCLLCAATVLGYLPWNWPSAWAARHNTVKRRAKIYMGDSGALALGGLLAMVAIFSRQEILLLMIGGAFVLEGLSALIQTRMMMRLLYRKYLKILRFEGSKERVPHTEFPLPFLATPLHHHFDLLGVNRRSLVYGAWVLGACFALLGVMVGLAPLSWQRYLARMLVLILGWLVWSSGSWSKRYFIGTHPIGRTRRRKRLALYYGYPYAFLGIKLYHRVEVIEASSDVIETPAEDYALWQRMNIFDARAILGLYCYRAGYYPAALAQWTRIPLANRVLRPEIVHLLAEVDARLALETQETQPMRLDQLRRKQEQEPVLSGDLPPADLPNPHAPVSSEEPNGQDQNEDWPLVSSSLLAPYNVAPDEPRRATAPISNGVPATTGRIQSNGQPHDVHTTALTTLTPDATPQNWFMRLIRFR
jgi:UDP-N-acetylmuramyl pentapeptide phosphotransferase/UDP-N-acetylglucosamine-1-phosphate transferase